MPGVTASDRQFDVAIIGAGPAGSAAAIRLARAGARVVLIDRKVFPREKVCGGCLSGRTVGALRELLGSQVELPGVPGTRITFVIGRYRLHCRAGGATRVVRRAELDAHLVDEALVAGAVGCFGEPAELVQSGGNWRILLEGQLIDAHRILLATGVGGLAIKLGIAGRRSGPPLLGQQWVQPAGPGLPEPGAVQLHWLRGGYVGLACSEPGHCVVALAAEVPGGAGTHPFERLRRRNPDAALWELLPRDAPHRYHARGIAGFPWVPARLADRNVLLVGDAAGYEEPYTGEGIGQALCSAACAAQALVEGQDVAWRYRALMRRRHLPQVRRTRLLSRFLRSGVVQWLTAGRPVLPEHLLAGIVERVHVKESL